MYVCVLKLCCLTALHTRQKQKVPHLNWCIQLAFASFWGQASKRRHQAIKKMAAQHVLVVLCCLVGVLANTPTAAVKRSGRRIVC